MGRRPTYGGRWIKRIFRIGPENRAFLEATARATKFSLEAVARLALRRYAASKGVDLVGWEPLQPTGLLQFQTHPEPPHPDDIEALLAADVAPGDSFRVYMRLRPEWVAIMPSLFDGEVRSFAGVLREAVRAMEADNPVSVVKALADEADAARKARPSAWSAT